MKTLTRRPRPIRGDGGEPDSGRSGLDPVLSRLDLNRAPIPPIILRIGPEPALTKRRELMPRSKIVAVGLVALCAVLIAAPVRSQDAQARCAPRKKAMDEAWQKSTAADAAWEKAVDALILAMEGSEAAERAYREALTKQKEAVAAWKAAVNAAKACLAKRPEPQCQALIDAARQASVRMAKAEEAVLHFEMRMAETAFDEDQARRTMGQAAKAAKAARDAYDAAETAYNQCLRGKIAA
jgi:hypothetical protein